MALDLFELRLQVERFDLERLLVDGAGQVTVEQAVLHVRQFGAAFGEDALLLGLDGADLAKARIQRLAEPLSVPIGQPDGIEFLLDGVVDRCLAPANPRVFWIGMVAAAAVIDMLVAAAAVELSADELTCHGEVVAGATEDASGERDVGVARPPVASVEDILADVEQLSVDQQVVAAFEHLAVALELANVEAVVEDV